MKKGFIILSVLLTIGLVYFIAGASRGCSTCLQRPITTEGFAAAVPVGDKNVAAVKKVFNQIKRVSGYLINRENWFYHMQFLGKSPTEMARIYLKSQRKSE